MFVPVAASAEATEEAGGCMVRADDILFLPDYCEVVSVENHDPHDTEKRAKGGLWVSLIEKPDGTLEVLWNATDANNEGFASLGVVTRSEVSDDHCLHGRDALVCLNLRQDVPVYYIDYNDRGNGRHSLLSFVNGIEYRVEHPAWEDLQPYDLRESADLDGDGSAERLIRVSTGGNCCPADISVVSYRGDGFFTFLDEQPISGGWGGSAVTVENGRAIIRIYDSPAGFGNITRARAERDFAIIDGRASKVAQRLEYSIVTEIAGLSLEDVKLAPNGKKKLVIDIDNDGVEDIIDCKYWERWGSLNCLAKTSRQNAERELQCHHVSVAPIVVDTDGSHALLCDNVRVDYAGK